MSERMVVHWSVVEHARAVRLSGTGRFLVAIWPSPVNPDSCFQAAGFDDFDDSDADWDEAADRQLDRVLAWLGEFGAPRLLSPPLQSDVPWYRRWKTQPQPLPLREQVDLPMHWDNLPDCRVRFGSPGAELITGQGHRIYWIALPIEARSKLSGLLDAASASHPRRETRLRWEFLLPPHVPT